MLTEHNAAIINESFIEILYSYKVLERFKKIYNTDAEISLNATRVAGVNNTMTDFYLDTFSKPKYDKDSEKESCLFLSSPQE